MAFWESSLENLVVLMIDLKKRIFITGVTGFVGANILHRLVSLWASDIHVLIRKSSDLSRIDSIKGKITIYTFSLEDRSETFKYIQKIWPQIVFHIAAAWAAVWRIPLNIDSLIQTNSIGSMNLMDASFSAGMCEIFVNTGSSSEYWQKDTLMKEGDSIEPNNLYGISKATASHYAVYLWKQKKFPIVTYRIFAAYWSYEDSKRLIPTLVDAFHNNIAPNLSTPYSVRDFIYIDDIVSAYLEADVAIKNQWDIINLGTGIQTSIGEIVGILQDITGKKLEPNYGSYQINQFEPKVWCSDNRKMKNILWIVPRSLKDWLNLMMNKI